MKSKIGLTHFWVLLLIFLLNGCMPDSMTKWEENPPEKKSTAPVVTVPAPEGYSYSIALGNLEVIEFDVSTTIAPMSPNETFVGDNSSFSVSPTLTTIGLAINSATGIISGTPTITSAETLYTFTATTEGGSTVTSFSIEVNEASNLTNLKYPNVEDPIQYLELNVAEIFTPDMDGSSSTWTVDVPTTAATTACPSPLIEFDSLEGMCFNTSNGVITGTPTDETPQIPFTVKVTASKITPPSSVNKTISFRVLELPSELTYGQSSTLQLSMNNPDPSVVMDRYIKIFNATGTTCTYAYIDDTTDSLTLLVTKHDPSYTYSIGDTIQYVSDQLVDEQDLSCSITTTTGMKNGGIDDTATATVANLKISSLANIFQQGEEFELTPTLASGLPHEDDIDFTISTPSAEITENDAKDGSNLSTLSSTLDDFMFADGILKGSFTGDFQPMDLTITATNEVGSTNYILKVSPIVQAPKFLNYSKQVLLRLRDASDFEVGEEITTPEITLSDDTVVSPARGKIVSKHTDPSSFEEVLIVDVDESRFTEGAPVDDRYPYKAEYSTIGGSYVFTVADPAEFAVGEYLSSDNAALGIITSIKSTTIYIKLLSGQFNKGDSVDDDYPYSAVATTILQVSTDKLIDGHTAILTIITSDGATPPTSANIQLPKVNKEIVSGVNTARITYVPHSNTAVITPSLTTGAVHGGAISTSSTAADGGAENLNIAAISRIGASSSLFLTNVTEPVEAGKFIQYNADFTGSAFTVDSAINNGYIAKIKVLALTGYEVGGYISDETRDKIGQIYHINETDKEIYLKNLSVQLVAGMDINPGETSSAGPDLAINNPDIGYGYRVYIKKTKGAFSLGDAVTITGATGGDIEVIEARTVSATIDSNGSGFSPATGYSIVHRDISTGFTGENHGIISHYNSITDVANLSVNTGIFSNLMEFDYRNPIDSGLGAYPRLTAVSTDVTFNLRREIPIFINHSVDRSISATFSITPTLPPGLEIDTTTGTIDGTPTTSSELKSYSVRATNPSFPNTPVYFSFNLKVEEFFEITARENVSGGGKPTYILHRSGKDNNTASCRITKDQISTNNYEDIDVLCRLEAGELDLYTLGLDLKASAAPGMCNHIQIEPYFYNIYPYFGNSDAIKHQFHRFKVGDCTPVQDNVPAGGPGEPDGITDYLTENEGGDGACNAGGGVNGGCPGACAGSRDDGDGDGDCRIENTPMDAGHYQAVADVLAPGTLEVSSSADGEEYLSCISNHSSAVKCDAGEITIHDIKYAPISGSTYCAQGVLRLPREVACGGTRSQCIFGGIKPGIKDEQIDAGVRSEVIPTFSNEVSDLPWAMEAPITQSYFSNRYIADYSINHPFFYVDADREMDYSFNILDFIDFFRNDNALGYGDPISGGRPMYTYSCLDAAYNPIVRIHIQVRDWDTAFDYNSPIDKNLLYQAIGPTLQTAVAINDNSIDLDGAINTDTSKPDVLVGSVIYFGNNATGFHYYRVTSVTAGTGVIGIYPRARAINNIGDPVYHKPIYEIDSLGRVAQTMDADWMLNGTFDTSYNKKDDMDNQVYINTSDPDTNAQDLTAYKRLITYDKVTGFGNVYNEIPNGSSIEIGHFYQGEWEQDWTGVTTGPVIANGVNGHRDIVPIPGLPGGSTFMPHYYYVRKETSLASGHYLYYRMNLAVEADTQLRLYPMTRPFRDEAPLEE